MALADRSDDFSAGTLDPKWQTFNASAAWSLEYGPGGAGGYLDLVVTQGGAAGMFWFVGDDGPLVYPEDPVTGDRYIEGDFECEIDCEQLNAAGDGPPPAGNARIAGVAAHLLPDPTTANPGTDAYSYFHAGAGYAPAENGGNGRVFEWKYTVANATTWSTISALGGRCRLRIVRIGSTAWVYAREDSATTWSLLYRGRPDQSFDRPMAVGVMAYSSTTNAQIRLRCHSITFRKPSNTMAATQYASQQLLGGTAPPALFIGFSTTAPNADGTGVTEPVGGAYARTLITFDAVNASGQMLVQGPVDLPDPTASWGDITHVVLYDAASGGNLWFYAAAALGTVQPPQVPSIADEALTIRLTP